MTESLHEIVGDLDEATVEMLVAHIHDLVRELQAEREVSDHWRRRAQEADQRVAQLETDRFASA